MSDERYALARHGLPLRGQPATMPQARWLPAAVRGRAAATALPRQQAALPAWLQGVDEDGVDDGDGGGDAGPPAAAPVVERSVQVVRVRAVAAPGAAALRAADDVPPAALQGVAAAPLQPRQTVRAAGDDGAPVAIAGRPSPPTAAAEATCQAPAAPNATAAAIAIANANATGTTAPPAKRRVEPAESASAEHGVRPDRDTAGAPATQPVAPKAAPAAPASDDAPAEVASPPAGRMSSPAATPPATPTAAARTQPSAVAATPMGLPRSMPNPPTAARAVPVTSNGTAATPHLERAELATLLAPLASPAPPRLSVSIDRVQVTLTPPAPPAAQQSTATAGATPRPTPATAREPRPYRSPWAASYHLRRD